MMSLRANHMLPCSVVLMSLVGCGGADEAQRVDLTRATVSAASAVQVTASATYKGSRGGGASCQTEYQTQGWMPSGNRASYPLFLYFTGTYFSGDPTGAQGVGWDGLAADAITHAMADRGYYALTVQYDNRGGLSPDQLKKKLDCVWLPTNQDSLLNRLCTNPKIDCSKIAVWGYSQGAVMAVWSWDYDHRINGVFLTGYGSSGDFGIDKTRMRVANGMGDTSNADRDLLNGITGRPSSCNTSTTFNCLDPSVGNGWFLVQTSDLEPGSFADHCWFDRKPGCTDATGNKKNVVVGLDAKWRAGSAPFSLPATADWLAGRAAH